jgi:hypothetical protein
MSRTRNEVLRALIDHRIPIEPVLAELEAFGWDSEQDLAILEREDILNVLRHCLDGEFTSEQVVDWADLLECREDVGFQEGQKQVFSHAIFLLANPNINGDVTLDLARKIQFDLGGAAHAI